MQTVVQEPPADSRLVGYFDVCSSKKSLVPNAGMVNPYRVPVIPGGPTVKVEFPVHEGKASSEGPRAQRRQGGARGVKFATLA